MQRHAQLLFKHVVGLCQVDTLFDSVCTIIQTYAKTGSRLCETSYLTVLDDDSGRLGMSLYLWHLWRGRRYLRSPCQSSNCTYV